VVVIDTGPEQVEFFVLEPGKGAGRQMGSLVAVVGVEIDIGSDSDSVHPASLGI